MLHLLQVYLIIEVDDIFRLSTLLIHHALCINLCDILLAWEKMRIIVDDRVKSYLLLITDLGNGVDGTHHQLVKMPVHEELRLARKHWLDDGPDYLLDFFWYFEHLAELDGCLSRCLEDSSKKEVVWQNLLEVFILSGVAISLLLHVIQDFDHARSSFPCQLTDYSDLNLSELALNLMRHIWVKLQENV